MSIPFVDLQAQYGHIAPEIDAAVHSVFEQSAFVLGSFVERFEEHFAKYLGVKHAIAVNSGTTALQLALMAHGIKPGDEVITAPNSFFASAESIVLAGGTPRFADVRADANIDPQSVEAAITPRTVALMPVHLYGQPADMDALNTIAARHNLLVIEDACQAHGSEYRGRKAGTLGDLACFSFYPGKNLGAYGEGGAIVTNDDSVAERARMLRDHGSPKKYIHSLVGVNGRMEGVQGAILDVKLKYLDRWNAARRRHAASYDQRLKGAGVQTILQRSESSSNWHLFVVRVRNRNALFAALKQSGIAAGIHYPVPIHLQPAFSYLALGEGSFPVAEALSKEIISLPMYAELTESQIEEVATALSKALPCQAEALVDPDL